MTRGTVVTTVFNGAAFVERYSETVAAAAQANPNLTWLLVDDGSSDSTIELLTRKLQANTHKVDVNIVPVARMGRARALNFAIERIKTDTFFVHDFDDISFPERFSAQAKVFDVDSRLACVGGAYIHVDVDRSTQEIRSADFDHERYMQHFPLYVPFPHTVMAFRTAAVKNVGGYPIWDDYEEMGLLARLFQVGWRTAAIPVVIAKHFVYQESFFEKQHGFARRRLRNFRRQLEMKRTYPFIGVSYQAIAARFAYNFLPDRVKTMVRQSIGYAR